MSTIFNIKNETSSSFYLFAVDTSQSASLAGSAKANAETTVSLRNNYSMQIAIYPDTIPTNYQTGDYRIGENTGTEYPTTTKWDIIITDTTYGNGKRVQWTDGTTTYGAWGARNDQTRNLLIAPKSTTPKTEITVTNNVANTSLAYTPDPAYLGDTITATLTANDGYVFATAPSWDFYDETTGDSYGDVGTLSSDKKTVKFSIATGTDWYADPYAIKIQGGKVESGTPKTEITVTNNVANTSLAYTPDPAYLGDTITATLTANDGYVFATAPSWDFYDETTGDSYGDVGTLSSDKKTVKFSIATGTDWYADPYAIKIRGGKVESETPAKVEISVVSGTLTNATFEYTPKPCYVGDSITFTWTATTGNYFATAPSIDVYNEETGGTDTTNATLASGTNPTTATLTFNSSTLSDSNKTITVNGSAIAIPPEKYPISVVRYNVSACSYTYTPETAYVGDTLEFTFTANENYYFKTAPYVAHYNDETADDDIFTATLASGEYPTTATLSIDTSTFYKGNTHVDVYASAELKPEVPTISYSFVNAYVVSEENLKTLASVRFTGGSDPANVLDLGVYVTGMKRFYVDVPKSAETTIMLGKYDTKVNANFIGADTMTIDCGNITINGDANNSNDYTATTIEAYLPFIGSQILTPDKVMNRTINVSYKINLISGDCVVSLTSDNILLYQFVGNVSEPMPYILNNVDFQLKGSLAPTANALYGDSVHFVVVSHSNYNADNTALIDTTEYVSLNTLSGLCCVEDVYITDTTNAIPDDEKQLITDLLRNGVIF